MKNKLKEAQHMHNNYPLYTVIDGVSNEDYHSHSAISSTNCKDLLKSTWLYDYNKNNPKPQTAAMAFGSLVHHLILEPETFDQYYFVALYSEALKIYRNAAQTGNFAVPHHYGQLIELAA